jgi:hypothetical protein
VLYFTVIVADCPGINGSLLHFGTVHPQDERTFDNTNGTEPVFVYLNSQTPSPFCFTSTAFFLSVSDVPIPIEK